MKPYPASSLTALTALAGAASAQTMATVSTDLDVRSGPGVQHPVIGAIATGGDVSVIGCIDSANGRQVTSGALDGEVVLGAGVPEPVTIYEIPTSPPTAMPRSTARPCWSAPKAVRSSISIAEGAGPGTAPASSGRSCRMAHTGRSRPSAMASIAMQEVTVSNAAPAIMR